MERRSRTIDVPQPGRYEVSLLSQGPHIRFEYLDRFVKLDRYGHNATLVVEEPTTATLFWRGDVEPYVELTRLGDLL